MTLDEFCTELGHKYKKLHIVDCSFPNRAFPLFKKAHTNRYIHIPGYEEMALEYAAGMASFSFTVLLFGLREQQFDLPDMSLPVKLLRPLPESTLHRFEEKLLDFGPAVIDVPLEN